MYANILRHTKKSHEGGYIIHLNATDALVVLLFNSFIEQHYKHPPGHVNTVSKNLE